MAKIDTLQKKNDLEKEKIADAKKTSVNDKSSKINKTVSAKPAKEKADIKKSKEKIIDSSVANSSNPTVAFEKEITVYKKTDVMKVLFVASESGPFIRSGGLGDVAASLPKALNNLGCDVRVILPLYFDIPQIYKSTMKKVGEIYVPLAWRYSYCGVYSINYENVTYYFIDNEYYFKRNGLYGHYDDAERFAFFSKACLESLKVIDFYPDVIHSNDWHTALVPVFLDSFYRQIPEYNYIKTVFTIHNIEFQGQYNSNIIGDILGLSGDNSKLVMYNACANFMKGGVESATAVTTVSETYAIEVLNSFYGFNLETILNERKFKLSGIINGIDTTFYNPMYDKSIFKNYNIDTIEDKIYNKQGLQELLGWDVKNDTPIIGMVGRLTEQKGIDLVASVIKDMLKSNLRIVILGKGDWKYENMLQELAKSFPDKLKVVINFSADLASKIYAGSDMFLMPSKFEPCGLSQLIAMSYGTVPIIRETGGLKDTVIPYNPITGEGRGFTFYSYNAYDMLDAINRAVASYLDKKEWAKIVKNDISSDFSWSVSAKKYLDLYKSI